MSKLRLTKQKVEGIKPIDSDIVVWDEALPGFGVRVKKTGVRSYVVQYRNRRTGNSQRMTLGQHGPRLTFHQAKKQARLILTDARASISSALSPTTDPKAEHRICS